MRSCSRCELPGSLVALFLLLPLGCGEEARPSAGTEGGPCFPDSTCDPGLLCVMGTCEAVGPDAGLDGALEPDAALLDGGLPDAGGRPTGEPCEANEECELGRCVDSYCCEEECEGECRSCGVSGSLGTCSFYLLGTDPEAECGLCRLCDGAGVCEAAGTGTDPKEECTQEAPATCGRYGGCDGAGGCRLWASGTPCSAEACVGSTVHHADQCDGNGSCEDGGTTSCGGYACDGGGTACLQSCGGQDDCAPGYICSGSGQCVPDPVGMIWVAIQGGVYEMGTEDWVHCVPVHQVTVPDFDLTRTEVTVAQYAACVTAGWCTAPAAGYGCNWGAAGYGSHPVNCVSWYRARTYCGWVGGRLPSESEWEYAARSGGQRIEYPWGDEPVSCDYAVMYESAAGCGTGRTMPVCSKPLGSSAQGLCDLAGNATEWVEDDLFGNYVGAPVDGTAWVDDPRKIVRTVRGGDFDTDLRYILSAAFRSSLNPSSDYNGVGFRCAR